MYRKAGIPALLLIACFVCFLMITGCQKGSSPGDDDTAASRTLTTPTDPVTPAPEPSELSAIVIDSGVGTIPPNSLTDVVATAYNESGGTVSGVALKFVVDNPALASVSSNSVTGSDGTASVLFQARSKTGTVAITASSGSVKSDPLSITIQKAVVVGEPGTFTLSLNPSKVLAEGNATVTAEVRDSSGALVPAGTNVNFEVMDEAYGTVSPLSSTTNTMGIATTTFTAKSVKGSVNISVSATNINTRQIEVEVLGSDPSAIGFVSTERSTIAVAGTSGTDESTIIQFKVTDFNNLPVPSQPVFFTIDGPKGGEYIDQTDDTPETFTSSTDGDGIAKVMLKSGSVAGPVTVQASITVVVDGIDRVISVRAPVVSIGGGVPAAEWFDSAATVLNLPGLKIKNKTTNLTGYLADRFGNFNILKNTTISFSSELGLASVSDNTTSVATNAQGSATVTLRTQRIPKDVQPLQWEIDQQKLLDSTFKTTFAADGGHPRDGLCSVLLRTWGEESFNDSDADGVYDSGETFVDTSQDPFIDYNDDRLYTGPGKPDPEEQFFEESITSPGWTGKNTRWDSNKVLFQNFPILITGEPIIALDTDTDVIINNGGSKTIGILICDKNMNVLSGGTKITISSNVGRLSGNTSVTVADTNSLHGPILYSVTLSDSDSKKMDKQVGSILVNVTWEGFNYEVVIGAIEDNDDPLL